MVISTPGHCVRCGQYVEERNCSMECLNCSMSEDMRDMELLDAKIDEMHIKEVNAETMRHILTVRTLLAEAASELLSRARDHDKSKLEDPEASGFAEYTEKLKHMTYGSDEYKKTLEEMKPFLDHHYQNNSHHPEYHEDGIQGMDLFDLLEMLIDWKASGLRHPDGSLVRSLEINEQRFDIPPSLHRILLNTVLKIEDMAKAANVEASYPHHGVD